MNPNWITRNELAALINVPTPGYVNELGKKGRAVRAPDGKHWLKAESLAAYYAGKDPSRQGVADRWATLRDEASNIDRDADVFKSRTSGSTYKSIAEEFGISIERVRQICKKVEREKERSLGGSKDVKAEPPPAVEDDSEDGDPLQRYDYQGSKAKREHWAAEREHANFRKDAGELMERSAVVAAFADAGATLRGKLEAWQAMLPPQLVGSDESAIRTTLADQTERLLLDLVEKFGRMAAQEGGAS